MLHLPLKTYNCVFYYRFSNQNETQRHPRWENSTVTTGVESTNREYCRSSKPRQFIKESCRKARPVQIEGEALDILGT